MPFLPQIQHIYKQTPKNIDYVCVSVVLADFWTGIYSNAKFQTSLHFHSAIKQVASSALKKTHSFLSSRKNFSIFQNGSDRRKIHLRLPGEL